MRLIISAAVALVAITGAAFAQAQDRGQAAQNFIRHCTASPYMASYSNPEPACACTAGIYSALMNDRQFYILGRVAHLAGDQAGMRAEVQALMRQGYQREEIASVAEILGDPQNLVDRTCTPLQR